MGWLIWALGVIVFLLGFWIGDYESFAPWWKEAIGSITIAIGGKMILE